MLFQIEGLVCKNLFYDQSYMEKFKYHLGFMQKRFQLLLFAHKP